MTNTDKCEFGLVLGFVVEKRVTGGLWSAFSFETESAYAERFLRAVQNTNSGETRIRLIQEPNEKTITKIIKGNRINYGKIAL